MPISLVTDSTADLPAEIVERYSIRVVPSVLVIGGQSFLDGVDMTREEFYRRLPTFNPPPTTAAPAAGEFEAVYDSLPDGPILSLHPAHTLTAIVNSARLGAERFGERVRIIDSGSLTLGLGWQIIAAAETIAAGGALQSVLDAVASTRRRVRVLALLDTLENLRRSGRISLFRASLGAVLQVKPIIELAEGGLDTLSRQRTRHRALAGLIDLVKSLGALERLAVLYTDNHDLALALRGAVAAQCQTQSLVIQVTPTIGTHIGANAVGVAAVTA